MSNKQLSALILNIVILLQLFWSQASFVGAISPAENHGNLFVGYNGTLVTDWRMIMLNRTDSSVTTAVVVKISNITLDDDTLQPGDYNLTFYYFQVNSGYLRPETITNKTEFTLTVDLSGYEKDKTFFVYQLIITTPQNGTITARISIVHKFSLSEFEVTATLTPSSQNDGESWYYYFVFFVIGVIFLAGIVWARKSKRI